MMSDEIPFLRAGPAPFGEGSLLIGRPIARVGDSLVYNATLDGQVVRLREFAPLGIVRRRGDGMLEPLDERFASAWADGQQRFLAQAQRLATLDHYGLPSVVQTGTSAPLAAWLATRPTGASLQVSLAAGENLPAERILRIAADLADALAYLHTRGLAHLDIAPDTVSLAEGWPELTDFAIDNRPFIALTGSPDGMVRPGYSPIERYDATSADPLGPPADIFGASALLYRLIEGHDPAPWQERFRGSSPALLPDRAPYPPACLAAIRRGLAIEPGDRFADGAAWQAALGLPATAPTLPDRAVPAPVPVPVPPPVQPMPRSNWAIPLLAGLFVLLLAGLGYLAYAQRWFAGPDTTAGPANVTVAAPAPAPVPIPEPETAPVLQPGATVAGRLTASDQRNGSGAFEDRFTIEARGGERLEISLSSPDFDPVVRLTGPGLDAANDDDANEETRDSRLRVTLPRAGRYLLTVSSYERNETGGYLLQLDDGASVPSPDPDVSTLDRTLASRLAGRWRSEADPRCQKPAIITIRGDELSYRIGSDGDRQRIVAAEGDTVRTEIVAGEREGESLSFRIAPGGDSHVADGETWTRC